MFTTVSTPGIALRNARIHTRSFLKDLGICIKRGTFWTNTKMECAFLAHLSQRLIGELILYPCSSICRHCRCRRCCCRHPPFSNVFSSETAWPIKTKFNVEPPWEGGTKDYINGPGHITKMAAMPIHGKSHKNLLLQNQKSYYLETWHVASETQALQS